MATELLDETNPSRTGRSRREMFAFSSQGVTARVITRCRAREQSRRGHRERRCATAPRARERIVIVVKAPHIFSSFFFPRRYTARAPLRYCHRPLTAVGFFFANPNAAAAREYIERFLRTDSVSCAAATLSYADRHLDAAADAGGAPEKLAFVSRRGGVLFASSAAEKLAENLAEKVSPSSAKLAFARALRGDNAGTAPETEPGFRFSR